VYVRATRLVAAPLSPSAKDKRGTGELGSASSGGLIILQLSKKKKKVKGGKTTAAKKESDGSSTFNCNRLKPVRLPSLTYFCSRGMSRERKARVGSAPEAASL
jgi:hypothetical protein